MVSNEDLFLWKNEGQNKKTTQTSIKSPLLFSLLTFQINNEIKKQDEKLERPVTEQIIEFSVLIIGEKYSEELSDPASAKHQHLSEQFISQVTTFPEFLFLSAGSAKQ